MYKKLKISLLVVMLFFLSIPQRASANTYTLNDLIEKGKEFDKKEVVVEGEAVGEALERKENVWININDKTNAMGIYMSKVDANKVKIYGGYTKIGDTIKVKGQFNRACKEHGGDMDIHSNKVDIIKNGKKVKDKLPKEKILIALVLSLLSFILGFKLYTYKKITK